VHGLPVNLAFELDYRVERNTEVMPAPVVELGFFCARPQVDITVFSQHPQEIPDLLLPPVKAAPFSADPTGGYIVMEPILRSGQQAHMFWAQPCLFK
jgi:hypothetical protein